MSVGLRQRGGALLEFAMALPFALTLFIGISDFSVYFWRQTRMEEAARMTAARIAPALASYVAADAEVFHRLSQTLQEQIRKESGVSGMAIALTRHYACPLSNGEEGQSSSEPLRCPAERVYMRISIDDAVEPILGPLRWMGFPETAFSRPVVRLR